MTGDYEIDAFAQMHNNQVRAKRRKAPSILNEVELKVIRELIPKQGVARIVTGARAQAEYIKVRLRKIIAGLGLSEMIGSSVQDNTVIFWRIAKYSQWRIQSPVEKSKIWQDAQASSVTLVQEYSKSHRSDLVDLQVIEDKINKLPEVKSGVNISILRILESNLADGLISQEEFDERVKTLKA